MRERPQRGRGAIPPGFAAAALAMALLAASASARAEDGAIEEAARREFSEELAVCAAFYLVTAEAYRRFEDSAHARVYTFVANLMIDRAVSYGEEQNVMARAKRATRELFALLGENVQQNMPVLLALHGEVCAEAYDYPDRRLQAWRVKIAGQR